MRGVPWMDRETGEWHGDWVCPECEVVESRNGLPCAQCRRAAARELGIT